MKREIKLPESLEKLQQTTFLDQLQTKETAIQPVPADKEGDDIIDFLKLIERHLKAIERNTFKGY